MTDFNSLPLADQLNALEPGDELHLRGGGWLPFVEYYDSEALTYPIRGKEICWTENGNYHVDEDNHALDIIRVVRPSARKGPEVVEKLNEFAKMIDKHYRPAMPELVELAEILADHFERDVKP